MSDRKSEEENRGIAPSSEASITIPVEGAQLASFISSLLGQPQAVERELGFAFDIDHDWLLNLHETLHQRISQQTSARLLSFKAVVHFDNGLKRTLSSVEAFATYAERQQVRSIGIQMEWSYLVAFPNAPSPEKQEISFHAKADRYHHDQLRQVHTPAEVFLGRPLAVRSSRLSYRVDYTERTWGNDLENLLDDVVRSAERTYQLKPPAYSWLRFGMVAALLLCCFLAASRITAYQTDKWKEAIAEEVERLAENAGPPSLESIAEQVRSVGRLAITGPIARPQGGAYVAGFFTFLLLTIVFLALTELSSRSFVVLSKTAAADRIKQIRADRRNVLYLVAGYLLSVTSSLLASFIYAQIS